LFEDGPGPDLDRDAIGLNVFDDVLVRVQLAGKELWIDPTSSVARAGQLPWLDQGRLALVIADSTTALVSTPAASAADNTSHETRTYELAEKGAGKVTEVVRVSGGLEIGERAWFRDLAPDKARKDLADYVENRYLASKLDQYSISDPNDLTKPFQLTLTAIGTRRAFSERMHADVYLFATDVLSDLPDEISHPPDKARVRKYDLVFPAPHVTEIENRIVIPPGFTVPTPSPDKTRELGTMKLVEQQRVEGQTFIVTFRLDTGKTRISPADVTRVQEAVRALRKEGSMHVAIEQTAKSLAAHGKYPEAIAELQRLIKLHPKEALHHSQLATILLDIGAGEAARREARKGTEVEPQNADAFVVYGWTLGHDTFGHPRGFDYDRAGAIAAYEKAHKLDPKHAGAMIELARLLERNPHGRLYDSGADVKRAIEMWRAAREIDDTTETSFALIRALLWVGDGAGAESIARSMEQGETRDSLLVAAVAIGKGGPAAAIRTADSLGSGAARSKILQLAMVTLLYDRQYDAMRSLAAELSLGNSPYTAVIQSVKRQAPGKRGASAEDVAVDMLLTVSTSPSSISSSPLFADKRVAEEISKSTNAVLTKVPAMGSMNGAVVEDLLRSSAHVTSQTEGPVTRVEIDSAGAKTGIYLVGQKGAAKVIGATDAVQGIGRYLLTLLAKNDEKTPARVLDWVAADLAGSRGPMMILSRVWGTNLPRTKQAMELAAAVLTIDTDTTRTIPIFKRCGATTTEGQFVCDVMLADDYINTQNWSELDDHTRAWVGRAKQTAFPMTMRALALAHLGKFDEADQVLADAMTAFPDERLLIHSHMEVAYAKRAFALAVQRSEPLTKRSDVTAQDLNNAAWARLVDGSDLPNAHLLARRAITLDGDARNILNTIAAIEAETKEVAEAKDNLDKSMRGSEDDAPQGGDWYVHGRIVEQLGLTDDAIAAYRKVTSKHLSFTPDSDELAARRLKLLGVKK
jgi:tetratricopeptide (TPR) repeat protein